MEIARGGLNRIACVQLEARFPDFCSQVLMPRYGLPLIGSLLRQAGYDVKIFIEHVAPPDRDWILGADAVLFSALTGAATRTYEFIDALRRRSDAVTVMGGEHATSFADDALDHVDYVVRREGDALILELLRRLGEGRPVDDLPGISYTAGGRKIHNPPGPVPEEIDACHDLDIVHGYPRADGWRLLLGQRRVKMICVQSTRGCPYHCGFCVSPRLFGYTYRYRDIEAVVDDIRRKLPWGRDFLFVDNLFAIHKERTHRLLDRMIEEGFGERAVFTCFCRVEIARQPDLLEKMYRAGVRTICLGMESIQDTTLRSIDKKQDLAALVRAIRAIQASGIGVSGSFLAGAEEDTRLSLLDTADFAVEHGLVSFYFISLWYYPGDPRCPMLPERLIMPSFDYCTGHFVTHFPRRMKPSTLQRTLVDAQRRFWNLGRAAGLAARGDLSGAAHIAAHRYAFRPVERHQLAYAEQLEKIEAGYYGTDGLLALERIARRPLDEIVRRAAASGVVALDTLQPVTRSETRPEAAPQIPAAAMAEPATA